MSARNAVNRLALERLPAIRAALAPLVGQKVLNQGAVKSAKLRSVLPEMPCEPSASGYYTANEYHIAANFKVCECYPSRFGDTNCAVYQEATVTVGEIDPKTYVLSKLTDGYEPRTNYTVEEVQAVRKELETAEEAVAAAQSKLQHFGKWDN